MIRQHRGRVPPWFGIAGVALALSLVTACSNDTGTGIGPDPSGDQVVCDLEERYFADGGVGRDGIPALTDPDFTNVLPNGQNQYLSPGDRVIAVFLGGEWLVIPHNIMWRHEIVNLNRGGESIAVTYCPLTGSALAFDRTSVGGAEFGVSGLLYQANLVMYDRNTGEDSLWPQMWGEARCGPRSGQQLNRVPLLEMTLDGWRQLRPASKVVAVDPAAGDFGYRVNPYGADYEIAGNGDFLGFPMPALDARRAPKERVLGIPTGDGGGIAYPFMAMAEVGDFAVFEFEHQGSPAIVLWDATRAAAHAFRPIVDGQVTSFRVAENGVVDDATGSRWSVDGFPVEGVLAQPGAAQLPPIAEAYVAFWGSWAAFHPGTELGVGG